MLAYPGMLPGGLNPPLVQQQLPQAASSLFQLESGATWLSETELDRLKLLVARRRAKTRATVFKDFCGHIVAKAPLETVALVLLRVNKRFRDASFDRLAQAACSCAAVPVVADVC